MAIENGNKVKIEYKAMFEDGKVFDSSNNFEFEVGKGTVIKGVNDAVIGMEKGEEKNITLKPNDAYGMPEKKYIIKIPKESIKSDDIKVGMIMKSQNGLMGKIIDIDENFITVDFNHPLAGKTLNFWIKIVDFS